ncbi:MAG: alpha-ketoacid dehydrogenase subunit beta [Candidatus Electryonea clarkiae]|nr:alpha-ketoacid dehydrogenase subunit beta [Candidatus Electryonea clarkiae]
MPKMNMIQAINLALHEEMEKDETVLVMGQDVGVNGGVFRATEGLSVKFGKERAIDTPLAESGIIGSAIGMAIAGLKPVAEIQFSGFSYLTLGQLEGNAARMRTRSRGQFTCPLVMRMPYGGGVRALEHHSESKETYWAHTAGLKVVIPSSPRNARALLTAAIRDPDPVIFMEPKHSYRAFKEEVPEKKETMEIGKAEIVREGSDLTLVSWGAMFHLTKKVVDQIQSERKVSIELIDLLTISPMDSATINASVRKTGRCVIVQEAQKTLGPASEIIARINDEVLMYLEAPVKRVSGYDVVMPYFGREKMYLPTMERIRRAIEETLEF